MKKVAHDTPLLPQSEEELAEIVKSATAPFQICGGGTRPIGRITAGLTALSTRAISGISLYEPAAMTLVAKAGTPLEEVQKTLARENQRFAFEPMDHRSLLQSTGQPTVGALLAANISGPRRLQTGACRDHALGVRFVDGTGRIIKNGGRVMKNVTGYDLVKLMAGSWGTLGIISEVSFKVMPIPEMAGHIVIDQPDARKAARAMSHALGTPYDVTGAAWAQGCIYIRLEGFEDSVHYRMKRLQTALAEYGEITFETRPEKVTNLWQNLRDVTPLQDAQGDIWRISVKPSDGPAVLSALGGNGYLDWGGGLVWATVNAGTNVRSLLSHISGHATCIKAATVIPQADMALFAPLNPALEGLNAGLRAKFDPRGLLNPKRMT